MNIHGAVGWQARIPLLLLLSATLLPGQASGQAQPTLAVSVRCEAGQTIARALRQGDERKPLTVVVEGTCTENVVVDRDDVSLVAGSTGGTVTGVDPGLSTITVTAARVTIQGLTVTAGRNGILGVGARALRIVNCTVENTGRTGIVFFQGASGTVDACTVRHNPVDGIAVESSSATVVNSVVSRNRRAGILLTDGSSGRIGVSNTGGAAGNSITENGSNGIHISIGSTAFIAANTISGNGTDPAGALGRLGLAVLHSSADLIGLNAITRNASHGVFARSASVLVGDPSFSFSSVNTITENGTAVPSSAGIFGFAGTSLILRNANVSGNNGFGVVLSLRSSAQMSGNTIQNNLGFPPNGDGIRLALGSGLLVDPSPAAVNVVTGNSGFGVNCTDGEASVVNTGFLVLAPPANAGGSVSPACTGF